MLHRSTSKTVASALLLAACGGGSDASSTGALPVLALGEPVLEIGVLEGRDELVLGLVESVVRLPDGTIAVSDSDATRISLFEPDGAFLRSWGRQGEGPGEFQSLARIYPWGRDSLMAAERWSGRLSVFGVDGGLGRLIEARELSGDSLFALDSWLYGRFWIEGALTAAERARARALASTVIVPPSAPGYRYAFLSEDGDLWVREPRDAAGEDTWIRIGDDGPEALVTTPLAFRPTHVRADEVLGVWSDPDGVHFARVYRTSPTGAAAPPPEWLSTRPSPATSAAIGEDQLMTEIRDAIRTMAGAQEMHYSGHMTYTASVDSLERFERPEGIHVDFLRADARGWAGVFSHRGMDRICGLAYGFGSPPGWAPGSVLCAPAAAGRP